MKSFLSDRPRHDQPAAPAPADAMPASGGLARLAGAPALIAHAHPAGGRVHGAPSVECIREGGRVARLVVTCACGERIEIDCKYDA